MNRSWTLYTQPDGCGTLGPGQSLRLHPRPRLSTTACPTCYCNVRLEKVAKIFEQTASAKDSDKARNFFVVRRLRGSEDDCCYAAILCVQGKWNKLRDFLPIARELSIEEKERIEKYISDK